MTDSDNVPETPAESKGPILFTFANHTPAPELEWVLSLFYKGVEMNTIGIMQALNIETHQEEVVLVGVTLDEEGNTSCYPLCAMLKAEDVEKYRSPDGKGGWYGVELDTEGAPGEQPN